MELFTIQTESRPAALSRRKLFALTAGCLGCGQAALCAAAQAPPLTFHSWTEKSDMTWEQIFRFAYQKDLIPLLKSLAEQVGRKQLLQMLRDAGDNVVRKKTAGRAPSIPGLATLAAGMKNNLPPLIRHALEAEIVEDSPDAFVYRVTKCLWAKMFVEQDAGDLGYAMVCYPDYAVAAGLNPRLKLIRNQTLMQGDDCCVLRYVMES